MADQSKNIITTTAVCGDTLQVTEAGQTTTGLLNVAAHSQLVVHQVNDMADFELGGT